jgi:hypothetical protein
MLQIQGAGNEAVLLYCELPATKKMQYFCVAKNSEFQVNAF